MDPQKITPFNEEKLKKALDKILAFPDEEELFRRAEKLVLTLFKKNHPIRRWLTAKDTKFLLALAPILRRKGLLL